MKKLFHRSMTWYEQNLARLSIIIGVFAIFLLALKLPYINIVTIYIEFLPFFLAFLTAMRLFHLHTEQLILPAIVLVCLGFFVFFFDKKIADTLFQIVYLFLFSHCIAAMIQSRKT